MATPIRNIAVIGDGGWGTTLAIYLARKKYQVTLWGAFAEYARQIQKTRINRKYLPGVEIPQSVVITDDLAGAVGPAQLLVLASPSQYLRSVLKKLKKFSLADKVVLSVVKGIETTTLSRMSEVIAQELGKIPMAVLSGPSISMEVVKGLPSTAVIASSHPRLAKTLQEIFHSETFRIYTNSDVVGLELGGSLKNIIAIACGVCDGLGYGSNTKAAILTRGLVEMARLGKAMGARSQTFSGLGGLGDLVTTCVSSQSRNRFVGEQLGKGIPIKNILLSMNMVAEGVETVKAAYKLSQKYNVPMPITTEVYNIISRGKSPKAAVTDLMTRKIKAE